MHVPPPDLDSGLLRQVLAQAWGRTAVSLDYVPVGFGSHHWLASLENGEQVFVTVDAVADAAGLDTLSRALRTARLVADDPVGSFAVAPVRTTDGDVVHVLPRYAVAVYPWLADAARFPRGPDVTFADQAARLAMLGALHGLTDRVRGTAVVDDLEIDGRRGLQQAVGELDRPWRAGPYGESARELLRRSAAQLSKALAAYDVDAAVVRTTADDWVLTHGEPHFANVLVTDAGLRLVDWDTACIAPAARDVWMLAPDTRADDDDQTVAYTELTGRAIPLEHLALYRIRWDLTEIALYTTWLSAPHEDDEDTAVAWRELADYLRPDAAWTRLAVRPA